MMRAVAVTIFVFSFVACGGENSPTGPTSTAAPPAPSVVSLSGTVSSSAGAGISGATVTFLDGPNSGRSATTNASGGYSFPTLTAGNGNLSATAGGYFEDRRGVSLVAGANTLAFSLQQAPLWRVAGQGNTVFDVPTYVRRVHVSGRYDGSCQNFVVSIGGRLIVNEILGTCSVAIGRGYDGTHQLQTSGGLGEVRLSTNVVWVLTEVR